MLRSCKYCGGIHQRGYECPRKPKRQKVRTNQSDIRSTNKWTNKSREIRERDHHLCQVCLATGVICYDGIEAHHIIPLEEAPEYAFDNDWLISLCTMHHKQADSGRIERNMLRSLVISPPTLKKTNG